LTDPLHTDFTDVYQIISDNEEVIAASLNDLNCRLKLVEEECCDGVSPSSSGLDGVLAIGNEAENGKSIKLHANIASSLDPNFIKLDSNSLEIKQKGSNVNSTAMMMPERLLLKKTLMTPSGDQSWSLELGEMASGLSYSSNDQTSTVLNVRHASINPDEIRIANSDMSSNGDLRETTLNHERLTINNIILIETDNQMAPDYNQRIIIGPAEKETVLLSNATWAYSPSQNGPDRVHIKAFTQMVPGMHGIEGVQAEDLAYISEV
jgi:hypothetical protein